MENTVKKSSTKSPREAIGFRINPAIKAILVKSAENQNIDPSDVYRTVFNAGLEKVYGFKIVGNELVG